MAMNNNSSSIQSTNYMNLINNSNEIYNAIARSQHKRTHTIATKISYNPNNEN